MKRLWRSVKTLPKNVPLRVQLVAVMLLLLTLALVTMGVAGTATIRGYLVDRVDEQLMATVQGDKGLPPPGTGNGVGQAGQSSPQGGLQGSDGISTAPALSSAFFREVVDSSGVGTGELHTPEGSNQTAPHIQVLTAATVAELNNKPFTANSIGEGANWRVLVRAQPDGSGALVVATSLSDVNATVRRLTRIDIGISLAALFALGGFGLLMVRASLRPLERVEETAEAIAAGDLSRRVDAKNGPRTEVGRLATSLNVMLGQIEQAFTAQQESEMEARVSEERMRRFIADASHELRTPLTSIRGFAELSRRQFVELDAEHQELMARIEREGERMGVLIEDLLLLARLDQDRAVAQEPVDLVALASDATQDMTAIAADHAFSFTFEDDVSRSHPVVLGDELRLRQILLNLLANAKTHTPAGTSVRVRVFADDTNAYIEVSDNGPGMPADAAEHVFERFYRSDPSRTRSSSSGGNGGGSGLGLSIVQGLVEAHGGSISLKTAPDEGATFTVELPLYRP